MQEELLNWLDIEGPKRGLNNDLAICDAAGLSTSVISKSRTGYQLIGWEACIKIAKAMGVPAQVVLIKGGHLEPMADDWDPETVEMVELFADMQHTDREEILMLLRLKNSLKKGQ